MPCFISTTLVRLIATSCHRLDSCSTLFCLSPKALHNFCILIVLQRPYEKNPPINIPKSLLKNSSCGHETAIYGPVSYIEYSGWPNIVDDIGLIKLSEIDSLALPQALSTVVAKDVSKLSMINASGGGFLPKFLFAVPWEKQISADFIPG